MAAPMSMIGNDTQIFFIYDKTYLKKEEDDLKDAIVYFYPHHMDDDSRCALCGQLMGMVRFYIHTFGSTPTVFTLTTNKFAVKHVQKYLLGLAGSKSLPDVTLEKQLTRLHDLFTFYHGTLNNIFQNNNENKAEFQLQLRHTWDTYLPFIHCYGDILSSTFFNVPYVFIPKSEKRLYLAASHLVQSCQRRPGVISGCMFFRDKVVFSQLNPQLTAKLLIIKPQQSHLPCQHVPVVFSPPEGVRLLSVYLTHEETKSLSPLKSSYSANKHLKNSQFIVHTEEADDGSSFSQGSPDRALVNMSSLSGSCAQFSVSNMSGSTDQSFEILNSDTDVFPTSPAKPYLSDLLNSYSLKKSVKLEEVASVESSFKGTGTPSSVHFDSDLKNEEKQAHDKEDPNEKRGSDNNASNLTSSFDKDSHQVVTHPKVFRDCSVDTSDLEDIISHGSLGHPVMTSETCEFEHTRISSNKSENTVSTNEHLSNTKYCDIQSINKKVVDREHNLPNVAFMETLNDSVQKVQTLVCRTDSEDESVNSYEGSDIDELADRLVCRAIAKAEQELYSTDRLKTSHSANQLSESEYDISDIADVLDNQSVKCVKLDMSDSTDGHHQDLSNSTDSYQDALIIDKSSEDDMKPLSNSLEKDRDYIPKTLETDASSHKDGSETSDSKEHDKQDGRWEADTDLNMLNKFELYVHGVNDVVIVLIMEKDACQNPQLVKALHNSALLDMKDINTHLKTMVKKHYHEGLDIENNYCIQYDNFQRRLSGNILNPVSVEENEFCETAIRMHEEFLSNPSATDITLRSHLGSTYGHCSMKTETYFHPWGSQKPRSGEPSERDSAMLLDQIAQKRFLMDNKSFLL